MESAEPKLIVVPISLGELVDKITILEVKRKMISEEGKLKNILRELELLSDVLEAQDVGDERLNHLTRELWEVNRRLWDIEDNIRDCERKKQFGEEFIRLAREVYKTNDIRARLKRDINTLYGSRLVEEKSYSAY